MSRDIFVRCSPCDEEIDLEFRERGAVEDLGNLWTSYRSGDYSTCDTDLVMRGTALEKGGWSGQKATLQLSLTDKFLITVSHSSFTASAITNAQSLLFF